jgi:hypothetical protein
MLLVKWGTVVILIRIRLGGDVVIEVASTCLLVAGMWRVLSVTHFLHCCPANEQAGPRLKTPAGGIGGSGAG